MSGVTTLIIVAVVMFCILGGITLIAHVYNLNNIKSKTVGDGQHGTARFATKAEIRRTYKQVPFTPELWRKQVKSNALPQGIIVGCRNKGGKMVALVDDADVHCMMVGAALNTGDQAMASVMSTVMSRLNAFLDSEMEQVLCFDTDIDAEKFCNEKFALFIVMPEENPSAYFMVSLLIQQLYREILAVADENGGRLKYRAMFYMDEFGTLAPIQSAEMMYSASRSRKLSLVSIIQTYQQLEKNYGREGASIIQDNCQLTIAGGFAPSSETAEIISKALGSRTVMTGSVSRSKNEPSQSLQMIERPLMTADELRSMKKGNFIVMKTGAHPFVSKLKLFFQWGISFTDDKYIIADKGARKVSYVSKDSLEAEMQKRYPCNQDLNVNIGTSSVGGINMQEQYHDCKDEQPKTIRTE